MFDPVTLVTLRPFALSDVSTVEPWLCAPGLSLPAGRASREWPQRLLADRRIIAEIAEAAGQRIGFVRLDCGPDLVAELTLVVAPEHRRRGLGSRMFEAALRLARQRHLRRLVALVDPTNDPALAFFAEVGFEPDGLVGDRVRLARMVHAGDHEQPLDVEV